MDGAVEGLARRHFQAAESLFLAPDIPERRERGARDMHRAHLPPGEPLLVLYDDTLVANGRAGYVVTPRRLCWKDDFAEPGHLEWWELQAEPAPRPDPAAPWLGIQVPRVTNAEAPAMLAAFLDDLHARVGDFPAPPWLAGPAGQVALLARRHLGKRHRVYHHPDIPARKLEAVRKVYGGLLPAEETVLVLYDDTFFGGGQDGFLATERRLGWKNCVEEPHCLPWREVDPEAWVPEGEARVRLGADSLQVTMLSEGAPLVAAFFRACAGGEWAAAPTWAAVPTCPACGADRPAGDAICTSCGRPFLEVGPAERPKSPG